MAKIPNIQQMFWYRYLGQQPVSLPEAHADYDVEIDSRELFGLRYHKKKFFLVHQDLLDEELPIKEHDVKILIDGSRKYTGKIENKTVLSGVSFDKLVTGIEFKSDTSIKNRSSTGTDLLENVPILYRPIKSRPKPKQIKFKVDFLDRPYATERDIFQPLSSTLEPLVKEALNYIGLLVPIKSSMVQICETTNTGTALVTVLTKPIRTIFIALNQKQLAHVNGGKLDAGIVACAITHELGHYIFDNNIVRASDKMRWKKKIAGLRFHKDQYDHGQGYPWHEEHWAMLCEGLVHGKSARQLQALAGWDIVEKYFSNVYFPDGKPLGEK